MEAKELRIGNYIETIGGINEIVVDVLCDCVNTDHHENILYDWAKPIPLTEEWLLKFGFVVEDDDFYFIVFDNKTENNGTEGNSFIDKIIIDKGSKRSESYLVWLSNSISGLMVCYRLKHVHQLQNLYHALTGKELTTK